MGVAKGTVLALALLAGAGCGSPNLAPLPQAAPRRSATDDPGVGLPPGARQVPGDPAADPAPEEFFVPPADPLVPSVDGDLLLPGVTIVSPMFHGDSSTATFTLRNGGARDLPDLILAVVFAVRKGDESAPLRPLIETVEAPLPRGATREFTVTVSAAGPRDHVESFRVAPGLPEVLAAREADGEASRHPGTTFLGGLLECVGLDVDLTGDPPRVAVSLAARGAAADAAPLPPLECQLLLGRAGRLVWTGPWILVPSPDAESGGLRRIRWTLHDAPGVAACVLFLRVRERR